MKFVHFGIDDTRLGDLVKDRIEDAEKALVVEHFDFEKVQYD